MTTLDQFPQTFDRNTFTESEALNLIDILASYHDISIRAITKSQIRDMCADTIEGIAPEFRDDLVEDMMAEVQAFNVLDDGESEYLIDTMQNLAANKRYDTVE